MSEKIVSSENINTIEWLREEIIAKNRFPTFLGILFFYGLLLGVIYNYIAFNLILGFDIFAYIEPVDLVLGLISNNAIVASSIITVAFHLIIAKLQSLSYEGKLSKYSSIISLLIGIIVVSFTILIIFTSFSIDNISNPFVLVCMSVLFPAYYFSNSKALRKPTIGMVLLRIIVLQIIIVIIQSMFSSLILLNGKSNMIKEITLIKGDKSILKDKEFQFITKTSSSTILFINTKPYSDRYFSERNISSKSYFTESNISKGVMTRKNISKKSIIVFNNADISTITFRNEY